MKQLLLRFKHKYIVHFEHLIYVKPLRDGILHLSLLSKNCGQWSILSVRTSLVGRNDYGLVLAIFTSNDVVGRPRPLTLNCPDFTKLQASCFLQSGNSISVFSFRCSFTRLKSNHELTTETSINDKISAYTICDCEIVYYIFQYGYLTNRLPPYVYYIHL